MSRYILGKLPRSGLMKLGAMVIVLTLGNCSAFGAPTPTWTVGPPPPTVTPTAAPVFPDECAHASARSLMVWDTTGATSNPIDPTPSCGNGSREKSVWFYDSGLPVGILTVFTAVTNYDTIIAVYTGTCGSLLEVACNDDYLGGGPVPPGGSAVSFQTAQDTKYYLMVTAYGGDGGTLQLQASFNPGTPGPTGTNTVTPTETQTAPTATKTAVPVEDCLGDANGDGQVVISELIAVVNNALMGCG